MHPHTGLRLGRLFGIEIAVDYSWLFIAVLMTWSLTAAFSRWHPDWPGATSLVIALAATLLFFASVLVHELAHSLVARRFGLEVSSITLFLFGGVSNIEREPSSAKAEFLTAVVGPITSIVLGVILLVLASVAGGLPPGVAADRTAALASFGPAATLLTWLGSINVVVGVFNLIPGFPLDGGRILRSAIWGATRDLHAATRWASAVGQAIGWCFVVLGVAIAFGANVPFFGRGLVAGLWLAFIGWFLSSAAAQSWYRQLAHEALEGVPVSRIMRPPGPMVRGDTDLTTFVNEWLMRSEDHAFLVEDDAGRPVGLVTLSDVRGAPRDRWSQLRVDALMTPIGRLTTTSPREDLAVALDKLARTDVGQLPVVDGGQLVGMLLRRDVARWIELHLQGPARRYAH
ncbi:MAG TPA: site-2 protease family protein [Polyangiaceae bacterium]|nr:site-2 protease family protein [Polyangiaceae bacterium]